MPHDCAIPSHVTGLYIFAVVNLIGLFHVSFVSGEVEVIRSGYNDTITSLRDVEANFGSDIPKNGVVGYLIYVSPVNISDPCVHYQPSPPEGNKSDNLGWIALIERNGCKFDQMVFNAQDLGYKAVMVYNQKPDEDLVPMGGDKFAYKVSIPSVFIGWTDGDLLRKRFLYDERGMYFIRINRNPNYYRPYMLWPFVVVVGICFVLMLLFMVVKWIRDIRKRKKSRLSSKHLKKIPTKKFKKGDQYDVCAVCLDDFEEGDKLRILPCAHAYHCKCIDPWLTKRKKTCPVCKRKVIPGNNPDSDSDSDSDEEERGTNERTPLLAGNNNDVMTTPRRSTYDNPGTSSAANPQVTQIVVTGQEDSSESDTDTESAEDDSRYGATGGASLQQPPISKVESETKTSKDNEAFSDSDDEDETSQDEDSERVEVVVNSNAKPSVENRNINHVV